MKVWTVILAGVLLAALPNLGNGALEDAGVYVANNYTKFEKRVMPRMTNLICSNNFDDKYEWFRIDKFEQLLLDFENGNNTMKARFRLGTPAILLSRVANKDDFLYGIYCKYLPKAFHKATELSNKKASKLRNNSPFEYFAVMVKDTERKTIQLGWKDLLKVVKDRFPDNKPSNYEIMIVEKTAAGVIYVGALQNYM